MGVGLGWSWMHMGRWIRRKEDARRSGRRSEQDEPTAAEIHMRKWVCRRWVVGGGVRSARLRARVFYEGACDNQSALDLLSAGSPPNAAVVVASLRSGNIAQLLRCASAALGVEALARPDHEPEEVCVHGHHHLWPALPPDANPRPVPAPLQLAAYGFDVVDEGTHRVLGGLWK